MNNLLKKPSVGEYTLRDIPLKLRCEDYDAAIKKIGELHKDIPQIHAIYRFGSMKDIGISDIDYFIVTNETKMGFRYTFPYYKLNQKERYILMHYPSAILPWGLYPKIKLLTPIFEKECIYGKGLDNGETIIDKDTAMVFLSDILFMMYPKVFIELLLNKNLNVRSTLITTYALRYPIELFKKCGVYKKSWERYVQMIKRLRSSWFDETSKECTKYEELISLVYEGVFITLEMIETYDILYKQVYDHVSRTNNHVAFVSRTKIVHFMSTFNKEQALELTITSFKKNSIERALLPLTIAQQLADYASTETLLGRYIAQFLQGMHTTTTNPLSRVRKQRCIAMSELLTYSLDVGYRRGAFSPFNLGYLNNVGVINKIKNYCISFISLFPSSRDVS